MTLVLVPTMGTPSKLREAAENLAKRFRRGVAQARAERLGDASGAARGGTA
jgi:hypothetical protein